MDKENNAEATLEDILGDLGEFEQSGSGLGHIKSIALDDEDIEINSGVYYVESFKSDNIADDKTRVRFLKACVKLVRQSPEYTDYLAYLKENYGLTICSFMPNVDDSITAIEVHHYPFSLYDVCETVYSKIMDDGKKITTFDIADEVLALHHSNMVGLVPLSKSIHELAHAGKIFINFKQVFGRVMDFIEEYGDHVSEGLSDNFKELYTKSMAESKFAIDGFFTLNPVPKNKKVPMSVKDVDDLTIIEAS